MLRTLIQKKEKIRGLMSELWKKREAGTAWSKEQREEYDKHSEEVKKLDEDIKLRSEYVETFQAEKPKAEKSFDKLQKKASIFNILKRQLFDELKDSRLKVDDGPIKEVIQERSAKMDGQFMKAGEAPVRMQDFAIQKRDTVTTGAGSAGNLVEESIYPSIVPNLYEKTWAGRIGVTFVENWRGDFLLPAEDTKPASGFIAETADYPESSIDYKAAISLKPLKVGALQPFSLQSFFQDETKQLSNSINTQLVTEWAKKVDEDFLNADGAPATEPKGILNISGIQTKDVSGTANAGEPLTFADIVESRELLELANQDMAPTWLLNAKVTAFARKTLRNSVAGSLYIMNGGRFGDMKYLMTNLIAGDKNKGTGTTNDLSDAILLVPSSVVIVHWQMPVISIDRSLGFKSDIVWTKVSGYCNIGLKRPSDVVHLQNIKTN